VARVKYTGWDYVKYLMAKMYCCKGKPCSRAGVEGSVIRECISRLMDGSMTITFLPNWNGRYYTVVASLIDTPPGAYAFIVPSHSFTLGEASSVYVSSILVCSMSLRHCRRYRYSMVFEKHGIAVLSIGDLLKRRDVVVNNQLKQ